MQQGQKQRNMNKRQFSSPSALAQSSGVRPLPNESKSNIRPAVCRKTDSTDDMHYSDLPNHNNQANSYYQFGKERNEAVDKCEGRDFGRTRMRVDGVTFEYLSEKEAKAIELRERLKNIHHFYRVRIEEQRNKNIERNEIFIGIIEQLQQIHNMKIADLQQTVTTSNEEDKEMGEADYRISIINKKVEEVIQKSEEIKVQNQKLEAEIESKQQSNQQKDRRVQELKRQLDEQRETVEDFERFKLKENRRMRDLTELVNAGF